MVATPSFSFHYFLISLSDRHTHRDRGRDTLKHQTQNFANYNVHQDRRSMPVDFPAVSL